MRLYLRLTVLIISTSLVKISHLSIAGVTYMDHFDFEERYRNIYECDPLYWHPLHLPSECAKIYEKIIRSRLTDHTIKIAKHKDEYNRYAALIAELLENNSDMNLDDEYGQYSDGYGDFNFNRESFRGYDIFRSGTPPFQIMLDALREDVVRDPSAPKIEMIPNLGMAAVYHQPISKKSVNIIKNMALGYGRAGAESYVQAGLFTTSTSKPEVYTATGVYQDPAEEAPSRTYYKLKVYPGVNAGATGGNQGGNLKLVQKVNMPTKKGNNKVKKKKIVKGNMVYYIETKKMS